MNEEKATSNITEKSIGKIGILGGTFDPIHNGHLMLAECVRNRLDLDKVIFMPCGNPPHKTAQKISDAHLRYRLVELATEKYPYFEVSDIELKRGGYSYTVDTVEELKAKYPKDTKFVFIGGGDILSQLVTWKDPDKLLHSIEFCIAPRPGTSIDALEEEKKRLEDAYGAVIHIIEVPQMDISSSEIRNRLENNMAIGYMVPDIVEKFIRENWMYADFGEVPEPMDEDEVIKRLQKILKPSRFNHCMGVMETAVQLAEKYGADREKARRAGLLHDCARAMNAKELFEACRKYNFPIDVYSQLNPVLLHAPIGSVIAHTVYGERDYEVLQAIRWHTTGKAGMTVLEKITYLADYIEPSRDFPGVDRLRKAAWEDLDMGVKEAADSTIRFILSKGGIVHPGTFACRNSVLIDKMSSVNPL